MVLETPYARAICDARPALAGHVLITSREHVPSVFDLDEPAYSQLRGLQQEIASRVQLACGEVGVYEHGRSVLCRFHQANRGHVHAHLHVLPVSFDLIGRSGYEQKWSHIPSNELIREDDRYLYQEIGNVPMETWATGSLPVQRHFVRAELQNVLSERGRDWIPLTSQPDEHDEAVDKTADFLIPKPSADFRGVELISEMRPSICEAAKRIGANLGWVVVDIELIYRAVAIITKLFNKQDLLSALDLLVNAFQSGEASFEPPSENSVGVSRLRVNNNIWDHQLFDPQLNTYLESIDKSELVRAGIDEGIDSILTAILKLKSTVVISRSPLKNLRIPLLRVFLLNHQRIDELPSLPLESAVDIQRMCSPVNTQPVMPQWDDFHFSIDDLLPDAEADLILTALRLRFNPDLSFLLL